MNLLEAMKQLLQPSSPPGNGFACAGIIVLLMSSAFCIYYAPLVMPLGYSWLSNSISESAAQGLRLAWISRLGFLLFGIGVLWLALYRRSIWARGTYWMQLVFAVSMLGTAAFSHKPWLTGAPFDPVEDFLHSLTATSMGFAFALGVVARLLQRKENEKLQKFYDFVAILASTVLTPIGVAIPSSAGLLQRTMFAIAYLWFIHEALSPRTTVNVTHNTSL